MADRAINVAVLEGDLSLRQLFWSWRLSGRGNPRAHMEAKSHEAMWRAKSTSGGFSVSFFWPAQRIKFSQRRRGEQRSAKQRQL